MRQALPPGVELRRRAVTRKTAATTRQVSSLEPVSRGPAAEHVFAMQRSAGNRAVVALLHSTTFRSGADHTLARASRWRPVEEIEAEIAEATRTKKGAVSAAQDVIEKAGRARPSSHRGTHKRRGASWSDQLKRALEDVMADETVSDELRREAQRALGNLDELEQDLERLWRERNHPWHPANVPKEYSPPKKSAQSATTKTKAPPAAKTAGKAEETAAKTVTKEAEKVAVKEAEKAAAKGGRLYARVAAKIGIELVEGLIPDPLDALELMWDFAGSYKEAWDRIKHDNLTTGFAMGLAAYLVIPRWEWAKYYARTTVTKDVATQVIGAVGIAENAYNEGLVRGFLYGEKHSTAQANRLRQKAFDALVKAGNMPGRYEGDDVYTFGRDDVYSFAVALHPTAVSVLKEADRRREARIKKELKESGSVGMKV